VKVNVVQLFFACRHFLGWGLRVLMKSRGSKRDIKGWSGFMGCGLIVEVGDVVVLIVKHYLLQ